MNIAQMKVLIYRFDINNFLSKTVLFPDQEKLLKEVVFSLAVSMNANTEKNIETLSMPKISCHI